MGSWASWQLACVACMAIRVAVCGSVTMCITFMIGVSGQICHESPTSAGTLFCRSLRHLTIYNCRLDRASIEAIRPLAALTVLQLPSCEIEWLPEGPFLYRLHRWARKLLGVTACSTLQYMQYMLQAVWQVPQPLHCWPVRLGFTCCWFYTQQSFTCTSSA